jgi:Fe-S-cluster-containing dehydrogenase component/CRP-like cAMP-binding protein
MTAWPASVWRSAWLEGLDAAARSALEAAGRLRAFERGQFLFEAGEPADGLFVVVDGVVEVLAVRRGDAEPGPVRRAVAGDVVGEDAIIRGGAARVASARCATSARVVSIPVGVYRRVRDRASVAAGGGEWNKRLLEAAARDVLLASSLARVLDSGELGVLAKLAVHRQLARRETLFCKGDPRTDAFVVADGMVSLEVETDGRLRVHAYLGRGDLVADGTAGTGARAMTARASGPAWVLALPAKALVAVERSRPDALAWARRTAVPTKTSQATRHVQGDLWRFAVAGSMLVIDDDACVRCGHCAWSCADAHADGVSRLVRRGEKVRVRDATDGSQRALIVPGSCQHCKHPACMIECPTGAIARGARGEVLIREDICVGCGQCERACPWDAVQMAPRPSVPEPQAGVKLYPQVAVKCDLCSDRDAGPACVRACPVEAIARVEPLAAMADVREAVGVRVARASLPRARPAWPWVLGAAMLALAVTRLPAASRGGLASGIAAGVLVLLLVGYSAIKRSRLARLPWFPRARPSAVAHLALGVLAVGVVLAHAAWRAPPNVAGAALVAFLFASVSGAVAGLAYAVVPRMLSRVERRARLPEELAPRARELEERTFGALTGRGVASKALYARVLAPYATSALGGLVLVASGRSLHEEETRLRARIDTLVEGRSGKLDGLADLVRLVVERRATRAQGLLQGSLRACVPMHLVAVAVALVLIVVHMALVVGRL